MVLKQALGKRIVRTGRQTRQRQVFIYYPGWTVAFARHRDEDSILQMEQDLRVRAKMDEQVHVASISPDLSTLAIV